MVEVCGSVIKKALLVAWDQWEHWSEILHEEGRTENLSDFLHINRKIQWELKVGPLDLLSWQQFYFWTVHKDLLKMTAEYRIKWLRKVITA